jgi:hypothetical protein
MSARVDRDHFRSLIEGYTDADLIYMKEQIEALEEYRRTSSE